MVVIVLLDLAEEEISSESVSRKKYYLPRIDFFNIPLADGSIASRLNGYLAS